MELSNATMVYDLPACAPDVDLHAGLGRPLSSRFETIPFQEAAPLAGHIFDMKSQDIPVIDGLSRHLTVSQTFAAVGGAGFLILLTDIAPQEIEEKKLDRLYPVIVHPGHGFTIYPGVWHSDPKPLGQFCRILNLQGSNVDEDTVSGVLPFHAVLRSAALGLWEIHLTLRGSGSAG